MQHYIVSVHILNSKYIAVNNGEVYQVFKLKWPQCSLIKADCPFSGTNSLVVLNDLALFEDDISYHFTKFKSNKFYQLKQFLKQEWRISPTLDSNYIRI